MIRSESLLIKVTKLLIWLPLLLSLRKRVWGLFLRTSSHQVPLFVSLANCILNLLECFLCLRVAVFVRMQLNGYLMIVFLDILLILFAHAFDKQRERCQKELVSQEYLIKSHSAGIRIEWTSSFLLGISGCIVGVERVSLRALITQIFLGHSFSLFVQILFLLLQ